MNKVLKLKYIYHFYLFISIVTSYYIFQIFYDSSTGLDFGNKYFTFIEFFSFDKSLNATDGQSVLYYYFISKLVNFSVHLIGPYNLNEVLNYSIQLGNFILQMISFIGLYKFYRLSGVKKENLFLMLSFLCFFPPLIYLRLTFKSEVLAMALLPWVLYFYEKLRLSKFLSYRILFVIFLSFLLTIKPSITGMVLVSLVLYINKNIKKIYFELFLIFLISILILQINQGIVGLNFFSHNDINTDYKWENIATLSFFLSFDLKSLLLEPFFDKQSGSLLSILLLDMFSDYFTFFWKHKEITNYLAFNTYKVSNNFYISRYLRDYIAIALALIFYTLPLYYFFKSKLKTKFLLIFFYSGLLILILNSLGIPSKNFNPLTGDTFKVHYFSFLLVISVAEMFLVNKKTRVLLTAFIPLFFFIMGFPKYELSKYSNHINDKINISELCYVIKINNIENCRNSFITTCKDSPSYIFSRENYFYYTEPILLISEQEKVYVTNSGQCFKLMQSGFESDLN